MSIHTLKAALMAGTNLCNSGYWISIQYPHQEGAYLDFGYVHSNGEREQAIGSILFTESKDGVKATHYTHP